MQDIIKKRPKKEAISGLVLAQHRAIGDLNVHTDVDLCGVVRDTGRCELSHVLLLNCVIIHLIATWLMLLIVIAETMYPFYLCSLFYCYYDLRWSREMIICEGREADRDTGGACYWPPVRL